MNPSIPFVPMNQTNLPKQASFATQPNLFGQIQPPTYPDLSRFQELSATQTVSAPQQTQLQRGSLQVSGRFVNDVMEVMPAEIPMDGRVIYFPLNDYSKIYAKGWDQRGNLCTVVYVPEEEKSTAHTYISSEEFNDFKNDIMARLTELTELVSSSKQTKSDGIEVIEQKSKNNSLVSRPKNNGGTTNE